MISVKKYVFGLATLLFIVLSYKYAIRKNSEIYELSNKHRIKLKNVWYSNRIHDKKYLLEIRDSFDDQNIKVSIDKILKYRNLEKKMISYALIAALIGTII